MKKYIKPAMAIEMVEVQSVILAGSTSINDDKQDLSGAGTTSETSGNYGNEASSVWDD